MFAATPRKRRQWRSVAYFDHLNDALAALPDYDDNGSARRPAWSSVAGGDRLRRTYKCTAHVDCNVHLRLLLQTPPGVWVLQREEGIVHAADTNEYDRRNASLTRAQKNEMRQAMLYGGTAAQVLAKLQFDAVKAGNAKKVNGEAGEKSNLAGLHSYIRILFAQALCVPLSQCETRRNA
jgi:hypothetical protein